MHRRTRWERRHLLARLAGLPVRAAMRALALVPHRGPTHSVLACALVAALAAGSLGPAGLGLALGYAAHVAADACTPSGVRAWWPLPVAVHALPARLRVRTGGAREWAVRIAFAAVAVLALARLV